jgi:beta-galactosidase
MFTNLREFELHWEVVNRWNSRLLFGTVKNLECPPNTTIEVDLYTQAKLEELAENENLLLLNVNCNDKRKRTFALPGFKAASEQFFLRCPHIPRRSDFYAKKSSELALGIRSEMIVKLIEHDLLEVCTNGGSQSFIFSKQTGELKSIVSHGKEVLKRGFKFQFWRAPIDNDGGWGAKFDGDPTNSAMQLYCIAWQKAGLDCLVWHCEQFLFTAPTTRSIQLETKGHLSSNHGLKIECHIQYLISANGTVCLNARVDFGNLMPELKTIPRIGGNFLLPQEFQNFSWFGRGPHHSYPDRKLAQKFAFYQNKVNDNFFNFPKPQENGTKTDCSYAALCDNHGNGILFVALDEKFCASVQNYSLESLTEASHPHKIQPDDHVTFNFDHRMMGVGGDDSWSPRIHEEFLNAQAKYSFSLLLVPLNKGTQQIKEVTLEISNTQEI